MWNVKEWFSKVTPDQVSALAQMTPVILMGRGHSGTRVLAWACAHLGVQLGTSGDLATGDADDHTFTEVIKQIALGTVGLAGVQPSALRQFQEAVFHYYLRLGSPTQRWGWKFPETYLIASYIATTFPQALYLHLVRDGRDIAFKEHLTDDPTRPLGKKILSLEKSLRLPHHLQSAQSWAFQVNQFDRFRQQLPPNRVMDVRFEDLCQDPHKTMNQVCQFLNISMTPQCEHYLQTHIQTDKVGQYRENDPQQVKEVEQLLGAVLKRYRYLPENHD